jgi:hypothetical protein
MAMAHDVVYRVYSSRKERGKYGVFEVIVYDDAPSRIGDEVAVMTTATAAQIDADNRNRGVNG